MHFINDPNFQHPFFKDLVRIDYPQGAPEQLINDFGYSYLMLRYGEFNAKDHHLAEIVIPEVFVKPTGDYFFVTAHPGSAWISFELPPTFFHKVTRYKTSDCRNQLIDLSEIVDEGAIRELYTQLKGADQVDKITRITDEVLSGYYAEWSRSVRSDEVVDFIFKENGLLSKNKLQETFAYSEKTLERMFSEEVGVPPSRFIRLVRFNFIIREIEQQKKPLSELINRYNYYDHSHFERDFKKFLGQSLKSYKNAFNPLLTEALARTYVKQ